MKAIGVSIIFTNQVGEVLLVLRDDKPEIPYPGMWGLPGGHIKEGESPKDCIRREMKEEFGLKNLTPRLLFIKKTLRGNKYVFSHPLNIDLNLISLSEGQRIQWFSMEKLLNMQLAYEAGQMLEQYSLMIK